MSTVLLPNLRRLELVITALGHRIQQTIDQAAYEAAQWGEAQAVRATNRSGVNASQTYARSWLSRRVKDGAIVANSSAHSYFVERGRKSGKGPPLEAIEVWIKVKKLMPDKPPKISRQASRKLATKTRITGNISGPKQRARLRKIVNLNAKIHRSDYGRAYHHKMAVKAMALTISRKIARRGVRGKWILGKLIPVIGRRYYRAVKKGLAKLTMSPPR